VSRAPRTFELSFGLERSLRGQTDRHASHLGCRCKCQLQDMRRARVVGAGGARLRLRWCAVDSAASTLLDHTPSPATQLDITSLHTTVWARAIPMGRSPSCAMWLRFMHAMKLEQSRSLCCHRACKARKPNHSPSPLHAELFLLAQHMNLSHKCARGAKLSRLGGV
jgi:hypothetical protein